MEAKVVTDGVVVVEMYSPVAGVAGESPAGCGAGEVCGLPCVGVAGVVVKM